MTKDEALQMCLEYIETDAHERKYVRHAIKAALEANEFNPDWDTQAVLVEEIQRMAKRIEELEAQRTWVGLTDAEVDQAFTELTLRKIYQAIEAKLKEKNT